MLYIELGLHRNMKKNPEPLLDNVLGEFCYYMSQNCEFHLIENGEYTNNEFSFHEITTKHDTIIYPYHYSIKFYNFLNKILFGSSKYPFSANQVKINEKNTLQNKQDKIKNDKTDPINQHE